MSNRPWSEIVGLRNRLIPGYAFVAMDVLQTIADTDLPALVRLLTAELDLRDAR